MANKKHPGSLLVVATAMCAALYGVGAYATARIESPWGMGQFRPAVIIPALFATIFGPWVGGIGAALGTLIADCAKHQTLYMGSLASVPGNFIGFFLFGYILKKKFNWRRFILASNVTLVVANMIVGFLYVFAYKLVIAQAESYVTSSTEALIVLSFGLTIFWFITMLPFVLLVTPPIIRVVAQAFPNIVSDEVRKHSLETELPKKTFSLAIIVPGIIMIFAGLVTQFSLFGTYSEPNFDYWFNPTVVQLLELLFYGSGIGLVVVGLAVLAMGTFKRRGQE